MCSRGVSSCRLEFAVWEIGSWELGLISGCPLISGGDMYMDRDVR